MDKENGCLLAQGQEQVQPSTLENLILCTVKICDVGDVDRNFCFQLISTTSERVFQAISDQDLQSWVSALQVLYPGRGGLSSFCKSDQVLQSWCLHYMYCTQGGEGWINFAYQTKYYIVGCLHYRCCTQGGEDRSIFRQCNFREVDFSHYNFLNMIIIFFSGSNCICFKKFQSKATGKVFIH